MKFYQHFERHWHSSYLYLSEKHAKESKTYQVKEVTLIEGIQNRNKTLEIDYPTFFMEICDIWILT